MSYQDEVNKLSEDRLRLVKQERDLVDSIKEGDPITAEQTSKLEEYKADIASVEARIRAVTDVERRERDSAELAEMTGQMLGSQAAVDKAAEDSDTRLRNWVQAAAQRQPVGDLEVDLRAAAKEREMLRAGASWKDIQNAIAWDTGSIASAVPTEMARSLYEYMEANIAAFRVGAQLVNTASGENMDFPYVNAHGIATQVAGQGTALAGTDPTFAKLTLGANKYGELVIVANEAITDAVFNVAGFLGQNIGRALGRLVDQHLINGTGGVTTAMVGSGVTPASGLSTATTGGTVPADSVVGLDPTWLLDAVHTVPDAYRGVGAAWLFKDSTLADIRKLRDGAGGTEGAFLWEPSRTAGLINGQPDTLLGYPVYADPNIASIASNNAIGAYGDFSTYYIRQVGNVQIDSSTERYFDTDQTAFRGKWRGDGGYIDANGVVIIKHNA